MALDAPVKTWHHDLNIAVTGASAIAAQSEFWFQLKESMCGFPQNPWAVAYSCDGSAAGSAGDGVDRWADAGDVVYATSAGSAHSWIVLANAATGMEILIECLTNNATLGKVIRLVVSAAAGFTGGGTTSSPSATDQRVILDGPTSGHTFGLGTSGSGTAPELRLHVHHANDGQATIIVIDHANECTAVAYFGLPESPVSGWTDPLVAMWLADTASVTTPIPATISIANAFWQGDSVSSAGQVGPHRCYLLNLPSAGADGDECFLVGPAVNNGDAATTATLTGETRADHTAGANAITGEHECPRIGLRVCSSADRGTHGRFFDMRWAGDELATGDTVPAAGTLQWIKQGPFLIPWDGETTPLVA